MEQADMTLLSDLKAATQSFAPVNRSKHRKDVLALIERVEDVIEEMEQLNGGPGKGECCDPVCSYTEDWVDFLSGH
jgi:hypothetical protein|tara:strand:- start:1748 stop:1975 length:228 start_codon:yes stop_codon:yes gene_type:complete